MKKDYYQEINVCCYCPGVYTKPCSCGKGDSYYCDIYKKDFDGEPEVDKPSWCKITKIKFIDNN